MTDDANAPRSWVASRLALAAATSSRFGRPCRPAHAASWDPRIEPLCRGSRNCAAAKFEHPVPGRLPLRRRVQTRASRSTRDSLSADDKADLQRGQSQLRSIGLLGDDVDLIDSTSSLQTSGAPRQVRPEDEACHRARQEDRRRHEGHARGRAHARAAGPALRPHQAPTEADRATTREPVRRWSKVTPCACSCSTSVNCRTRHAQAVRAVPRPPAPHQALAENVRAGRARCAQRLVPDPVHAGPAMLEVVEAVNGQKAIDGLFRDPPKADSAFLTPSTLVDDSSLTKVATPTLAGRRACRRQARCVRSLLALSDAGGEVGSGRGARHRRRLGRRRDGDLQARRTTLHPHDLRRPHEGEPPARSATRSSSGRLQGRRERRVCRTTGRGRPSRHVTPAARPPRPTTAHSPR